jgi:hypothetical protein
MNKLVAAAAVALVMTVGASAKASEFVTNGNFTNLTNGLGQLGFNTDAVGWSSAAPDGSYNFVFDNGNTPLSGQFGGGLALWTQANGGGNGWDGANLGPGNFVAIDGAFHAGPISQTITGLTIGQSYHLSFNYAFAQQFGFDGDLSVSLGAFSATSSNLVLPNHGFSGWSTANFDIIASATSELLSFSSLASPQLPPFALVSDVSLTSVPEPGVWAMMLIGFSGLGVAARVRRRRLAA